MEYLALCFFLLCLLPIILLCYIRWHYGELEGLGFPVIQPHWIFGSNLNAHNEVQHYVDLKRSEKYGQIYGVYHGREPLVFISDPEILRIIQIRDFAYFQNHRQFFHQHEVWNELLDFIDDEKWSLVRSQLTPAFTLSKVKIMSKTISDLCAEYTESLAKDMVGQNETEMIFKRYTPPLLMEIIAKCFCGITIPNARDPENQIVKDITFALETDSLRFDWTSTLVTILPFLTKLFPMYNTEVLGNIKSFITGILKRRGISEDKAHLQNILSKMFLSGNENNDYNRLRITKSTAIAQAFGVFNGSYEIVRVLPLVLFHISNDEEIQKKLQYEVDKISAETVDHEAVSHMPYLEACITETFRLSPTFIRLDRRCTKDWEHNGIRIKKGMSVMIPLWPLHRNSKNYPDPEQFNPDRFLPGNKEKLDRFCLGTFGHGPRNCIAKSLAIEMLKFMVVHIIKKFKIMRRNDTRLCYVKGNHISSQYIPLKLNLVKRN